MAKYLARNCPRCNGYLGIVLREPGRNVPLQAVNGHCLGCGYRMSWIVIRGGQSSHAARLGEGYRHMANKRAPNRALSGEQLAKATAEKVFGWKNVHKHEGELIGKKQDKAGRWRKEKCRPI